MEKKKYNFPEVKLGQYKDLDVTRTIRKVTDAEVDSRIEQEQKRGCAGGGQGLQ